MAMHKHRGHLKIKLRNPIHLGIKLIIQHLFVL